MAKVHCLVLCSLYVITSISQGLDILEAGQVFKDGDTLESPGEFFQLKFFTLEFSNYRYLGIQDQGYNGVGTGFVWIANRDRPLMDYSGVLSLTTDGVLTIKHNNGSILLNLEHRVILHGVRNFSMAILDSGNLVLRGAQEGEEVIIWQSFDYPTDTLLPGMKLGLFDLKSGKPRQQFLTSWLSPFIPGSGAFTLGVDRSNPQQLVILRRGTIRKILNIFAHLSEKNYSFDYTVNENESFFALSEGKRAWIALNSSSAIFMYIEGGESHFDLCNGKYEDKNYVLQYPITDKFKTLNSSNCSSGDELFVALNSSGTVSRYTEGGEPHFDLGNDRYDKHPFSDYCVPLNPSNCSSGDEFLVTNSYAELRKWTRINNSSLSHGDCQEICRINCSCTAYSVLHPNGTGCLFSTSEKLGSSPNLWPDPVSFYMRSKAHGESSHRQWAYALFSISSVAFLVLVITFGTEFYLGGKKFKERHEQNRARELFLRELHTMHAAINGLGHSSIQESRGKNDHELPLFSFCTIECATANFSNENKLGQGGFGPVYKGKLESGQEIAVKRLSKSSGQGIGEFKNEVILISKLQHRNLVRLLGCCIHGEEKLLIYEYMPKKSLDTFLFDAVRRLKLDWRKRFCIIEGIAQGLLYLHKYSRLKIIHRDLKTSNVLLDSDLNPKISDFGLARAFGDNESQANTMNIAGTRGYMSPEYAMGGLFSEKSDVFSYGVMVLEIISGKRNASFYHDNRFLNLLGYAWSLWREERALELMDPGLLAAATSSSADEVISRCVQIGLLCVQENAGDRPTMSDVLSMLNNEMMTLRAPKKPAFYTVVGREEEEPTDQEVIKPCSINEVTVSSVNGR